MLLWLLLRNFHPIILKIIAGIRPKFKFSSQYTTAVGAVAFNTWFENYFPNPNLMAKVIAIKVGNKVLYVGFCLKHIKKEAVLHVWFTNEDQVLPQMTLVGFCFCCKRFRYQF